MRSCLGPGRVTRCHPGRRFGPGRCRAGTEQQAGDHGGRGRGQQRHQAGHLQAEEREAADGPADAGQIQPDDQRSGVPGLDLAGDRERGIVGPVYERDVVGPVADRLGDLQPATARVRRRGRAGAYQLLAVGAAHLDADRRARDAQAGRAGRHPESRKQRERPTVEQGGVGTQLLIRLPRQVVPGHHVGDHGDRPAAGGHQAEDRRRQPGKHRPPGWRPSAQPCRSGPAVRKAVPPHASSLRAQSDLVSLAVPGSALVSPDGLEVAGGAVDGLPQQVGVAVVPGVLLDHVRQDPAQRELLARARGPPPCSRTSRSGAAATACRAPRRIPALEGAEHRGDVGLSTPLKSPSGRRASSRGRAASSPSSTCGTSRARTSAMCRTSPSRDRSDGGTDRCRSCSSVSPSHFQSRVAR